MARIIHLRLARVELQGDKEAEAADVDLIRGQVHIIAWGTVYLGEQGSIALEIHSGIIFRHAGNMLNGLIDPRLQLNLVVNT